MVDEVRAFATFLVVRQLFSSSKSLSSSTPFWKPTQKRLNQSSAGASWQELAGLLVFSAIPCTVIKATANSPLGESLQRRLLETKTAALENSSKFKALAVKARQDRFGQGPCSFPEIFQGDTLDYLGIPGLHTAGSQEVIVIAICQALLMGDHSHPFMYPLWYGRLICILCLTECDMMFGKVIGLVSPGDYRGSLKLSLSAGCSIVNVEVNEQRGNTLMDHLLECKDRDQLLLLLHLTNRLVLDLIFQCQTDQSMTDVKACGSSSVMLWSVCAIRGQAIF